MPIMDFVSSSNIEAIGYDADVRELHVRFLRSGKTYVYSEFDQQTFDEFRGADSKGKFFNQRVLNQYPTREI